MSSINFPPGFGLQHLVAWGNSGLIVLDKDSSTVIKSPHDEECVRFIIREQHVYERFVERGGHKRVLRYDGIFGSGIRLEYAPNHNLRSYLEKHDDVAMEKKGRWAVQIAEALDFIHQSGVIHGDLTWHNILLDEDLDIKLADFAGSSLDGSEFLVAVTPSHRYPGPTVSIKGDLFAFGSVLYQLLTGNPPYDGLSEEDTFAKYSKGIFPRTESLDGFGSIITKCWQGEYSGCKSAIDDLKGMPLQCKRDVTNQIKQHNEMSVNLLPTDFLLQLPYWSLLSCYLLPPPSSSLDF